MEPHPAFAHLALGPGEGKISLYALRLMGIRAGAGGCFDLQVELDTVQPRPNSDDEWDADPVGDTAPAVSRSTSPALADGESAASPSTSIATSVASPGPSIATVEQPDPGLDEEEDRAKTPPWASTLPVTCTVGPPPQIPHRNYFNHVNPLVLREMSLPAWPDVYGRR